MPGETGSVRTVVVGNRKLARHLLRHLLRENWTLVGALAQSGTLASEQANFAPLDQLAERANCPLHRTDNINDRSTVRWLREREPDICICGGWSQIIDQRVLDVPSDGFLGLHASCLPKGRGGAPVNWSLIRGADAVWMSLFYYTPSVDAGDIVAQGSVPVTFRDDVRTVFDKLAHESCRLVSSVRNDIESGSVTATPQRLEAATYRPRRQPQDGLVDWTKSPRSQYDWVRAQTTPYPGAYTFHDGSKLTIWEGIPVERQVRGGPPGEVLAVREGDGIEVRTGTGAFRITRLQVEDRPPCWADTYAREFGLPEGDKLGRHAAPAEWLYTGLQGLLDGDAFDTNLSAGERGTLTIVAFAGSNRQLTISVSLDDESIFRQSVTVDEEYTETVTYSPTETGTHTLKVEFETAEQRLDTRYLKVFVHD